MKTLLNRAFNNQTFPILLVNFLGILGYSVVIPILIYIVTKFGGNGFIYGIVGAAYPFFQFLGAPRLGRLSDRVGRRNVLIITQIGSFLAWSLFLLAFAVPEWKLWEQDTALTGAYTMTLPLVILTLARIVDGYTGGNISVANAYMADISTEETRGKNFGLIGASTSLGFIVGPVMAGILTGTPLEERLPLIVSAILALATAGVIYLKLGETVPVTESNRRNPFPGLRYIFRMPKNESGKEGTGEKSGQSRAEVLRIKDMPALYAIYFLVFFSFSLYYVALPIYASRYLGWDARQLGLFLAYFSLMMILVQGPLLSSVSKRFDKRSLVLFGSLTLIPGFMLLTRSDIPFLYLGVTVMALGNGLMWPSFLNILGSKGDVSIQGSIQGYGASMGSIARMTGLITGGILFEVWSTHLFFLAGGVFVLIFALAYRVCRT